MRSNPIVSVVLISVSTLLFCGCSLQGNPDGGVFKSLDGGNSFDTRNQHGESGSLSGANILDLEVDGSNTQVVYLGTQELGILRSTNGGDNWVRDRNNFISVEDIVLNPNNSNELYITAVVGGIGKVKKTMDGGQNWEEVFTERTSGARVLSLAMDKNNTGIVYAGDTLGGIYKTMDGGSTWTSLLWASSGVNKIVMDSVNTSKIYFVTSSSGVLRSDDAGGNFTEIESSKTVYDLATHPSSENVLFISDQQGLHRSNDAGATLIQINTLVQPEKLGSRGIAVNPDNDNEIYFASGRAFYKTSNGGQTWKPIQFKTTRTIETIRVDPANINVIYVGTNNRGQSSGLKLFPF